MKKYTNKAGKECYKGVRLNSKFSADLFHRVFRDGYGDDKSWALHTNHGSLTVLDRMTGFGHRDVETGFREPHKGNRNKRPRFWLASGNRDVRNSGCKTIGEAIDWVKERANSCVPKDVQENKIVKHRWTGEQITALEGSIKHHKEFKADPNGVPLGVGRCPCCKLWNNYYNEGDECVGCPIHAYTGKSWCGGTPYIALTAILTQAVVAKSSRLLQVDSTEVTEASQKEIDFLEEVLAEGIGQ